MERAEFSLLLALAEIVHGMAPPDDQRRIKEKLAGVQDEIARRSAEVQTLCAVHGCNAHAVGLNEDGQALCQDCLDEDAWGRARAKARNSNG